MGLHQKADTPMAPNGKNPCSCYGTCDLNTAAFLEGFNQETNPHRNFAYLQIKN